jgi:wyosine [tRNA(Phe)-imidazoG37] synthetase (radical SAM superfamily)
MKTVYGPIPSWRLGRSIGIDPVCERRKICSFDCIYCQLGPTLELTTERREFIKAEGLRNDLKRMLDRAEADIITFSGTSEPTLASNLGELAKTVKELSDLDLAILTNSSLLHKKQVRRDLDEFDIVVAKLDASNQEIFEKVSKPHPSITFETVLDGIKKLRKEMSGKLILQMMFLPENRHFAKEMSALAKEIGPDEVQLNTPLRKCAAKPLSEKEMDEIEKYFLGQKTTQVYGVKKPKVKVQDMDEMLARRPEL